MTVHLHLLFVGRGRFELYAEPPDDDAGEGELRSDAGRVRRWLHQAREQWQRLVDRARLGHESGAFARWRDSVVCHLADSIDDQRTLWALRKGGSLQLLYPDSISAAEARKRLDTIVAEAGWQHGKWAIIDLLLFLASGVLFFIPGPNIVAYYLGFRTFGHFQSWRGARAAQTSVQWTLTENSALTELGRLADQPRTMREGALRDIAHRLHLEHLPAFFERASA